jgi:hypothetical protein
VCLYNTAGNIVIAIAATKNDLVHEPTTEKSLLVPSAEARELADSVGGIFIDTSARNDENVNLLFQKVAQQVLLVRNQGLEADGIDAIQVTPGASINKFGKVVKGYPRSAESRNSIVSLRKNHPINNLSGNSPSKPIENRGHSHLSSTVSGGGITEETIDEVRPSMGLCMGPLMECSSTKGDSSCIIC